MSKDDKPVELKVPKEITDKGWLVPLWYLDTTFFTNPGGTTRGTEVGMSELKKSLAASGQLQAIHTSPSEDGERLNVVCGFRRSEARTQMALEKLLRLYNKAKDLKPGDDGFVNVTDPQSRAAVAHDSSEIPETDGDTWVNAYERAMKEEKILVSVEQVVDAVDAALKNLTENQLREDFTITELTSRIQNLLEQDVPQKRIAKGMGLSEPKVSQMIKVGRLPSYLHEFLVNSDEGLKSMELSEKDFTTKVSEVNDAIKEVKRRMGLPKGNRCSVSFSHLRDFSGRVITGKNKKSMPASAALASLMILARMVDGKISENKESMDFGPFLTLMDDATKRALKFEKAAATAEEASEDVAAGPGEEGVSTGKDGEVVPGDTSVSDVAAAQAETEEANAAAEDAAVEAAGGDRQSGGETEGEAEGEEATEGDRQSEAIPGVDTEATMEELAGPSDDDQKAGEVTTEAKPTGQTATTTVDAPVEEAFTVKDPAKVKIQADQYKEYAASTDGDVLLADRACFLMAASELYSMIGMETEAEEVHSAYVDYVEGLNAYVAKLQDACSKSIKDKDALKALADLRPVYAAAEGDRQSAKVDGTHGAAAK